MEGILTKNRKVRQLSNFQTSYLIINTQLPCRIDRDGSQGVFKI
jgi:hypothetical protein